MIILINGPFVIGKTTAIEVARILPSSVVFEPEKIGAFLRRLLGSRVWRRNSIERGLAAAHDPGFGCVSWTEGRSPEEVAAEIVSVAANGSREVGVLED